MPTPHHILKRANTILQRSTLYQELTKYTQISNINAIYILDFISIFTNKKSKYAHDTRNYNQELSFIQRQS